jgi:hypothetical protein
MLGYSYSTLVLRQRPKETGISARRGRQKVLVTIPLGRSRTSVLLTLAMSVRQAAEGEEAFTSVGSVK